ncbi:DUF982 domain-containing protein [Pseudaminobacter sp. 19-2017]|uniref:DUF982 domain-containing protein n=1 Tax=Pseudaminobacter soli (ex Zhang et al. 2022) TaxID=2831468 RepID=A0A942I1M6_9HYPH|nr:DUF982 domain-containing protein [Pseudaminobacter soli]
MNAGWFSKPVAVAVGIIGDVRNISSASEAAALLQSNWREQGSAKQQAALRACLAAMYAGASPEKARAAFLEAAEEARVLAE